MRTSSSQRVFAFAIVVGLVTLAVAVPPAAAQNDTDPAFIVDVRADGSANVLVRSTFDLTTDVERDAFMSLMDDEQAQLEARDRFLDRMRAVASDAENATGREMGVTDATIELQRTANHETGIVTLSVTWEGLAAVEGETLQITEPFASGYTTERPFVLRAPDGYTVVSKSPEPDRNIGRTVSWEAGSDLTGFSIELAAVETPTPTKTAVDDEVTDTDGQPGFGMLAALIAVLAAAVVIMRRTNL